MEWSEALQIIENQLSIAKMGIGFEEQEELDASFDKITGALFDMQMSGQTDCS